MDGRNFCAWIKVGEFIHLIGVRYMRVISCAICLFFVLASSVLAQSADSIQVEVVTRATASWDGSALPTYADGTPEITILRITIPPKARLPLHVHPVINAGVLLRGELTVVKEDGETIHLEEGDAIVELVDKRHYGRNDGEEPAEILVFYVGTEGDPITIRK